MRPAGEREAPGGGMMDTRAAYRRCEEITWNAARNFAYGIRLLPPAKRQALAAVYAFARRIDDIGDGPLPASDKLAALGQVRASLCALAAGRPDGSDPVLVALADAAGRFAIPLAAFGELIEGCEADVRGTSYRTFDDLLHYCRCVAGSVGRLSLGVFGTSDPRAAVPLADSLGVALQLTNILRDIAEDYAHGRVYLPAEDLERFGCHLAPPPGGTGPGGNGENPGGTGRNPATPGSAGPGPGGVTAPGGPGPGGPVPGAFASLVRFEAERARGWYERGFRLLPLLDRRSAACAAAMAGIYFRLLRRIADAPGEVLRTRVSLPATEKVLVAAGSLATAALRRPAPGNGAPRKGGAVPGNPPAPGEGGATGKEEPR
jgi:phytoene synthase